MLVRGTKVRKERTIVRLLTMVLRLVPSTIVASLAVVFPARAQDNNPPPRLGVHFAYDVASFAGRPLHFNRFGAQAMFPLGEVWSLYPAMSGVFDTRVPTGKYPGMFALTLCRRAPQCPGILAVACHS